VDDINTDFFRTKFFCGLPVLEVNAFPSWFLQFRADKGRGSSKNRRHLGEAVSCPWKGGGEEAGRAAGALKILRAVSLMCRAGEANRGGSPHCAFVVDRLNFSMCRFGPWSFPGRKTEKHP